MSRGERKAMITRDAPELSLSRQCRLLSIGRSSFYYAPRGESPSSLALMRRIDELSVLRQPLGDGPPLFPCNILILFFLDIRLSFPPSTPSSRRGMDDNPRVRTGTHSRG